MVIKEKFVMILKWSLLNQ